MRLSSRSVRIFSASFALLALFAFYVQEIVRDGRISGIDAYLLAALRSIHSPALLFSMLAASTVFDPPNFIAIAVLSCALLYLAGFRRDTLYAASVFCFAFALDCGLKLALHIARPDSPPVPVSGFSFPSGHATMATAFFLTLCIVLRRNFRSQAARAGLIVLAFFLSGLVGLSRMYLGAHWLSDVVGGMMVGSFAALFLLPFFGPARIQGKGESVL